jgi:hypothetical protein
MTYSMPIAVLTALLCLTACERPNVVNVTAVSVPGPAGRSDGCFGRSGGSRRVGQ